MKNAIKFVEMFFAVILISLSAGPSLVAAEEISSSASERNLLAQDMPIASSMNTIDQSMREIVSAVIAGDGKRVISAINPISGTMDIVYASVESGRIKLRNNAEKKAEFRGLKENYQADLQNLKDVATNNNWNEMLRRTKSLMDDCVRCHQQFK